MRVILESGAIILDYTIIICRRTHAPAVYREKFQLFQFGLKKKTIFEKDPVLIII